MNEENQKYIKENRMTMSMKDMATVLGISYNRVRQFMIDEDIMLTKDEVQEIKRINRSKPKPWNWNALP